MSNAERFLNAYAQIEETLNQMVNSVKYQTFGQMLTKCAQENQYVAMNQAKLREYHELRNAIVHFRGTKKEIIAEPCDSVTEDIERIAELLRKPENIMDYVSTPVVVLKPEQTVREAFSIMKKLTTSKLPVYENNVYLGLVIMRDIAGMSLSGKADAPVRNILLRADYATMFLAKKDSLSLAVRGFEQAMNKGHALQAVIVSEHGRMDEAPLGILTFADLPKVLARYN